MTDLNQQLFEAIANNNLEEVKKLIAIGADIHALDSHGELPINRAQDTECIKLLIDAGADVNMFNKWFELPIHLATMECNTDKLKLLIEAGADVNACIEYKTTALHIAASRRYFKCILLLLDNGANHLALNEESMTPFEELDRMAAIKLCNYLQEIINKNKVKNDNTK